MKVLYLNSGNIFGGIETLLLTIAQYRDTCPGMIPEFGVCFEGRYSESLREAGVPVYALGEARMSRPWQVWKARRRLRKVLRDSRPDVVVCHGSWSLALLGPAVRDERIPLVYWTHDRVAEPLQMQDHWAKRTPPDFLIANSHYTAGGQAVLYAKVPSQVIYCALAPPRRHYTEEERAAFRASQNTPPEATVILQVSRVSEHKGHRLHLEALGRMAHLPWICWIVAGPQLPAEIAYLAELKALSETLGIAAKVRWLGWQKDVEIIFESADVFCQPNSGPEMFGLTFVEALWRGKPVVTTAMAGALEVLTEECGILTEPGNVAGLTAALSALVEDPALRERLGAAGPARAVFLCDPKSRLEEVKTCLERVLRKR